MKRYRIVDAHGVTVENLEANSMMELHALLKQQRVKWLKLAYPDMGTERDPGVAAIREREQAATKGPWERDGKDTVVFGLHSVPAKRLHSVTTLQDVSCTPEAMLADAEFIAHAREDIPRLLATTDDQAGEIAGLREHIADMWNGYAHDCDDHHFGRCSCSSPQYQQCAYGRCPAFAAIDAAGKGE